MSSKVLVALGVVLVVCAVWLFTADIHADDSSFCGSAYDVVLLEGDGFIGGEIPENQRALDRQCVRKAGRSVALGSAIGAVGIMLAGVGIVRLRMTPMIASAPDDSTA